MSAVAATWKKTRSTRSARSYLFLLWILLLVGLVAQGLYSFARQTADGHHLTNLSDTAPWGLYIVGFVFFVGASAGSTVIGLMAHAFGRKDYERLATRAILVGFVSLAAAVTFIAVDVGRIPKMLALPIVWHNPTSMFFYTSITYYLFGLILLGELYYTVKITRGTATTWDRRAAKWLSIAAVPFALAVVHAPHGALFAVVKSREFWNNPLLPPHFAVVAVVSGTALMLLVAVASSRVGASRLVGERTFAHMGGLLAFFLAVAGFFDFFDWLVFAYSDKATGVVAWDILFGSNIAPSIIHVAGYVAAFGILLVALFFRRDKLVPLLAVAAGITLVAVAAYRYNLVTVGLATPLLPFVPEHTYWPSGYEISIAVGIVALIALTYSILVRLLPTEEEAELPPEEREARRLPAVLLFPWRRRGAAVSGIAPEHVSEAGG